MSRSAGYLLKEVEELDRARLYLECSKSMEVQQ